MTDQVPVVPPSLDACRLLVLTPVFSPAQGGIETLTEGIVERLRPQALGLGGEGFGSAYIEAAAGLPVVAGNAGGVVDAISEGRSGLLVDPVDPLAVADATITLLSDGDRPRRMGDEGRAWAAQFTWERAIDSLTGVINGPSPLPGS